MLILSQSDIERLLPMPACVEVMASALSSLARGEAVLPLRTVMRIPNTENFFAAMPGYVAVDGEGVFGAKLVTVFPGNQGTAFDSHQGAVLIFDNERGGVAAVLDGTAITGIRTAAVSGVATRALAREDAKTLAILGSGVQAHSHLRAMCAVRSIQTLRVWSRTPANALSFAEHARREHGLDAMASPTGADAVIGADIVCVATSSNQPVLLGEWLSPGTHVNAVGVSQPHARELDSAAVVRSRLYVDRRESALNEPGDILAPLRAGEITPEHIVGEIGEVLVGRAPGRASASEITLFKSLGLAIEDLASASYVYAEAVRTGAGVRVELGGARVAAH
jgi:ornithine cyclodeaminase/alanine dehydrogenase-like protein (mu-crystallin family)